MPRTTAQPRERCGRRTVTLDLRNEDWERLAALAREKDLPASTMARMLLLPALATSDAE
jgi:hypothetical protein